MSGEKGVQHASAGSSDRPEAAYSGAQSNTAIPTGISFDFEGLQNQIEQSLLAERLLAMLSGLFRGPTVLHARGQREPDRLSAY
jgi:hypothetical protein